MLNHRNQYILFTIFAVLSGVDIATTLYGLNHGEQESMGPAIWFLQNFGYLGLAIGKTIACSIVALALAYYPSKIVGLIISFQIGMLAMAAILNIYAITH